MGWYGPRAMHIMSSCSICTQISSNFSIYNDNLGKDRSRILTADKTWNQYTKPEEGNAEGRLPHTRAFDRCRTWKIPRTVVSAHS